MSRDGIIRQLSSREVFRNERMSLREDEVEFPDGSRGTYTVVDKPDFVVVVPFDGSGFWLVEQYRYPVGRREWEFPQGGWPAGRSGTSLELAAAELREETGLTAGSFTHLGRLNATHGFASQHYDVYLATDLTSGEPDREASEADMRHARFAADDVHAMARAGRLRDAHSLAALYLFAEADLV